jgi:hypothetical protein
MHSTDTPEGRGGEREWRVVELHRPVERPTDGTDPLSFAQILARGGSECETYYPASHPAVLSPEEARMLVDQLDFWVESTPDSPVAVLKQRLTDYTEQEDRNGGE